MGFCIFNNIAVAAAHLRDEHGVERVLVVDWDVHHGNGTEHAFYDSPDVLYLSVHQYPHYPGTGAAGDRGAGRGEGFNLNVPMAAGADDAAYLAVFNEVFVPRAKEFRPEFVLISAGFDAHLNDPLAGMRVTEEGFRQMTRLVRELAEESAGGRIVSFLEGGYHPEAMPRSVAAHLEELGK
jgi:acetoin utilization deacetylase AcuC-like enzyme